MAGVPQLVMPMAFDQHDNADRLERLGVARRLRLENFRGRAVASLLRELRESPSVRCDLSIASDRLARWLDALRPVAGSSKPSADGL